MYYGYFGVGDVSQYPVNFLRIFGGVALGAFIYEFIYIFNEYFFKINKKIITIVEMVTFLLTIVLMYKNLQTFRFIIFCYVISLSIMFTGYSYTNKYIKGKLVVYLGKLSMPIFIIHWYIGTVINEFTKYICINNKIKLVLYYGLTILSAMGTLYVMEHWQWYQKITHEDIKMRD